jgi:hypothetical protein
VAYFLLQRKAQLGGAKSITKMKIWGSENENHEEPNIIFYVGDTPPPDQSGGVADGQQQRGLEERFGERILRRSANGKALMRENVIHVKL